jgi:transcriptional regulator with XRE-family HTH domain
MIDQQILAVRLRHARIDAGLTQESVAQSLGIPRTAVVQFEMANRLVSSLEIAKLAELYGRTIASFFEES